MSPDASQPGNCLSYAADTVACYQIVSNREPAVCLLAARRVAVLGIRGALCRTVLGAWAYER